MRLIADSGSTKTDWRCILPGKGEIEFRSEGINPYFHTSQSIADTLRLIDFSPYTHEDFTEVFFYSAGSSTTQNKKIMREGFSKIFTNAKVNILHDLLGAARALFHDDSGIAAILGTGSNSCLYIDKSIKLNLGGHGYILGDEGSGMHLGRKVIRDFMNDLMPSDVREMFVNEFGLTKDQITFAVYKKLFPNRFLASFSKFVRDNISMDYFHALADDAFMKFFERYIIQYPNYKDYPLRIVGSVGHHFEDFIKERAKVYDVNVDRIIKAPIDGLIEYHSLS